MARVWPNTFVEPANLTVHVAALRRALKDGHGGDRYLVNIPGRGYCFVAPVKVSEEPKSSAPFTTATERTNNLPASVTRLIARSDTVSGLSARLSGHRLLTVVGPGGIGKTSVALAVAEGLLASYEHGVWFIDLTPLGDPLLVPRALASSLGLTHPLRELGLWFDRGSRGQADAACARQLRARHRGCGRVGC